MRLRRHGTFYRNRIGETLRPAVPYNRIRNDVRRALQRSGEFAVYNLDRIELCVFNFHGNVHLVGCDWRFVLFHHVAWNFNNLIAAHVLDGMFAKFYGERFGCFRNRKRKDEVGVLATVIQCIAGAVRLIAAHERNRRRIRAHFRRKRLGRFDRFAVRIF